jgi:hypothetical protein
MALNIGVHIGVFGFFGRSKSTLYGHSVSRKMRGGYHDTGGAVTDFGSTDFNCV